VSKPEQIHLPRGWWKKIESQQAEMDLQLVDIEDEMQHFERLEQRRLAERRRLARREAAKAANNVRRRERAARERKEAAAAAAAQQAADLQEQTRRMEQERLLAAEQARKEKAAREERVQRLFDDLDRAMEKFARSTGKDYFVEVFARACVFRRVPIVAFIRHAGGSEASRSYTTELGSVEGVTRHVWEVTLPKISLAIRYTQEKYTPQQNPRTAATICLYCRWGDSDWRPVDTPHDLLKVAGSGGSPRSGLVYQAMLGAVGLHSATLQDQMIEYLQARHAQAGEPAENS
jgi:hypothetical protein